MTAKRKTHAAAFKAQVALAAVRGDRTVNELAAQFGAHPTLIHGGTKQLLAGAEAVFAGGEGQRTPGGQVGRTVRADRAAQGRARLGEKKAATFG
jgi:transposase-like protein